MKLSKLIRVLVGVLAVVAFALMFSNQINHTITVEMMGQTYTETKAIAYNDVFFQVKSYNVVASEGATLSFIAYIVVLITGILVTLTAFLNNKAGNFIALLSGILMLVASFLIFFIVDVWKGANANNDAFSLLYVGKLTPSAGAIFAGIFALIGGVGAAISAVLPQAKSKKKSKKRRK